MSQQLTINIWYSNSILQFIKVVTMVTIRFNEGNNSGDNRITRINVKKYIIL